MMAGWCAWVQRFALLLGVLVFLPVSACAPPGAMAPPALDPGTISGADFPAGAGVDGRFYALSLALAREQQRAATLQQQLEERGTEIERLHTEVEQLRGRQTQLEAAVQAATTAGGGTGTASPPVAAAVAARPAGTASQTDEASGAAAVRAYEEQRARVAAAEAAAARATAALASVRAALAQEQQQRQETEAELDRLKQETSVPAYGASGSAADIAAAKQEVADLRGALDNERAMRQRLAHDFEMLQQQAAAPADSGGETKELQARLQELQQQKDAVTESFTRSLADSQKHAADLEQQLATVRTVPVTEPQDGVDVPAIRAENAALRSRLDEEHHRTEELAAKLKLATRVTDLIFKMQAQQAQSLRSR